MGPFDPRIIKSITNNRSEGTELTHSQAKKPFPSSHTAATPENPEQAQNEETQERKQPRTTVVLSPGSSIKSPLGRSRSDLSFAHGFISFWMLTNTVRHVDICSSRCCIPGGTKLTGWWNHDAPGSTNLCEHVEGRVGGWEGEPPPYSMFQYCPSLKSWGQQTTAGGSNPANASCFYK